MADGSPSVPLVRLVHVCDGRMRLRPAAGSGAEALRRIADAAAEAPGARRVLARPSTGSVIVEADAGAEALRDWLEGGSGLRLAPPEPSPPPLGKTARLGLLRLDAEVRRRTEGALDVRSALAFALLAGAVVQLTRGRIAGPATTLLVSALALIEVDDG